MYGINIVNIFLSGKRKNIFFVHCGIVVSDGLQIDN